MITYINSEVLNISIFRTGSQKVIDIYFKSIYFKTLIYTARFPDTLEEETIIEYITWRYFHKINGWILWEEAENLVLKTIQYWNSGFHQFNSQECS